MVLLIDNYDSFVQNLARYIRRLKLDTCVVRNDRVDAREINRLNPRCLVLSPGPCTPDKAGNSLALVAEFAERLPILGVCLGHQIIVQYFGGRIVRNSLPVHGQASPIYHGNQSIFANIPSPFLAGRYHSLVAQRTELPDCLAVTAWTADAAVMAVAHQSRPIIGLQFHPESILTEYGYQLLFNFFELTGLSPASPELRMDKDCQGLHFQELASS
jgi:anthranilate synthase component 2